MTKVQGLAVGVLIIAVNCVLWMMIREGGTMLSGLLAFNGAVGAFVKSTVSNSQTTISTRTLADCTAGAIVGGLYNHIVPALSALVVAISGASIDLPTIDADWNPVEASMLIVGVGYVTAHFVVNMVDKFPAGGSLLGAMHISSGTKQEPPSGH